MSASAKQKLPKSSSMGMGAEAGPAVAVGRRREGQASPGRPGIGDKQLSASDLRAHRSHKVVKSLLFNPYKSKEFTIKKALKT